MSALKLFWDPKTVPFISDRKAPGSWVLGLGQTPHIYRHPMQCVAAQGGDSIRTFPPNEFLQKQICSQ